MSNVTQLKTAKREIKRWTEDLRVNLTPEEKWDSSLRSCELTCEIARLEELKAFQAKQIGDQLKELKKKTVIEAISATTGATLREVEVVEEYDTFSNEVTRTRLDTGEMIGRRRATESEIKGAELIA